MNRGDAEFPTSLWDRIKSASTRNDAVDEILRAYRAPLLEYLRRKRPDYSLDECEEVVQQFLVTKVLGISASATGLPSRRTFFDAAEMGRGRFRTFLVSSLNHFCVDRDRARMAGKRHVDRTSALPGNAPETRAGNDDEIVRIFDAALALRLLSSAIQRFRQVCEREREHQHWGLFVGRILPMLTGEPEDTYPQLAARLGFRSAQQAANVFKTVQNRLRRCWNDVLREQFADGAAEQDADLIATLLSTGPELLEELKNHLWGGLPNVTVCEPSLHISEQLSEVLHPTDTAVSTRAEQLRFALECRPFLDVAEVSPALEDRIRKTADPHGMLAISFAELLQHDYPDLEILRLAQSFAKEHRVSRNSGLSPEVATVLYYASLATAWNRHRTAISRLTTQEIAKGYRWVLDQAWIPDWLRPLFLQAQTTMDR